MPLPQVRIFGGGSGSGSRADVEDFMAMPIGAGSFDQAHEWVAEVQRAAAGMAGEWGAAQGTSNEEALDMMMSAIERAGLVPGDEIAIALDVAASALYEDGLYRLALEGAELDADEMIDMLAGWLERYPIRTLENPLAAEDAEGLARLTEAVGERVQIVAGNLLGSDAARVAAAVESGAGNALLLDPAEAGTVSEARAALDAAREAGWDTIAAAGAGGSEDATIAHLAIGWGLGQLKSGAFAGGGQTAWWNEALRIEEAVGTRSRFGAVGRLFS